MTSTLENFLVKLKGKTRTWLVTGAAGFIGSHLVESLLLAEQKVIGFDNFSTGRKKNIDYLNNLSQAHDHFSFISGDVIDLKACRQACEGVDIVLHQAALGSVPRSIEDPLSTHQSNVNGTLNVFLAARDAGVKRVVYASSSSIYGDEPTLPKKEALIGKPLSPYAVTKLVDEIYADVFFKCYGVESVGLRYFNVFGPRQDPEGAYAAVIPKWLAGIIKKEKIVVYGDGSASRDFCFVKNVVQANLLAATTQNQQALGESFNVAVGQRTTLVQLYKILQELLQDSFSHVMDLKPDFTEPRSGDIPHSLADISKIQNLLGYVPEYDLRQGLEESLDWYKSNVL